MKKLSTEIYLNVIKSLSGEIIITTEAPERRAAEIRRRIRLCVRDAAKSCHMEAVVLQWDLMEALTSDTPDQELGDDALGSQGLICHVSTDRMTGEAELLPVLQAALSTAGFFLTDDIEGALLDDGIAEDESAEE